MNHTKLFLSFLLGWFILNVIVAYNTKLYSDEAYYWMYSQFLDWSYFDHPPGVALIIWMGQVFGKTELSVRIIAIILITVSLFFLYKLVKPRDSFVFFMTLFCFLSLHIMGFTSLPDTPFFFSSILFMIIYKHFLIKKSTINTVSLGVLAAIMLYSKYHGILVIIFVILSHIKLLTNIRFLMAMSIGFLLFIPHLWWQFSNHFPSLTYHIIDRKTTSYSVGDTLEYIFGNIPFHGGLVAIVLFYFSFYNKKKNKWHSALQWNLYGTLMFFFFITLRGQRIEPNWTVFCVFPLIYLGYKTIEKSTWFKFYKYLVALFSLVMIILKIHLIHPLFVIKKDRIWDFHLNKSYIKKLDSIASHHVLVANRYQDASVYNFYTQKTSYITSLNINSRKNQYDIWKLDSLICNKDIAYINNHLPAHTTIKNRFTETNITFIKDVTSPAWVKINKIEIKKKEKIIDVYIHTNFRYKKRCLIHDMLFFDIKIIDKNNIIQEYKKEFKMSAAGDSTYHYALHVNNISTADRIAVSTGSMKFNGGKNISTEALLHK